MLDPKLLRNEPETAASNLARRGVELELVPHLSLGGELALEYYTSSLRANDLVAVTTTLETRGAVLLTFSWDDPRTKSSE